MKYFKILLILPIFLFANANIDKLIENAKKGDSAAIFQLGYCYENGIDVKKDLTKAKELYKRAAKLGSQDAKITLGLMTLDDSVKSGKITHIQNSVKVKMKNDFDLSMSKEDLKELLQKAKSGDKDAIFAIGALYESGFGLIKQDREKAMVFYKKAASLGSQKAKKIILLRSK